MPSTFKRFQIALRKLAESLEEDGEEASKLRGKFRRAIRNIWNEDPEGDTANSIRRELFELLDGTDESNFVLALNASRSLVKLDAELRSRVISIAAVGRSSSNAMIAIIRCVEFCLEEPQARKQLIDLLEHEDESVSADAATSLLNASDDYSDIGAVVTSLRESGPPHLQEAIREYDRRIDEFFITFRTSNS